LFIWEDNFGQNYRPELRGPELRGPELRGPELRGPELRGPELRGPELRGQPFEASITLVASTAFLLSCSEMI